MRYINLGCGKVLLDNYVNVDLLGGNMKADILHLPFIDNSFHGALASHVLEHIPKLRQAMIEIHRILKKDSLLIIHVPYGLDGLYDVSHVHVFNLETFRRFTEEEKQSLEYGRLFEIESQGITDYKIPFEWFLRRTRFLNYLPKRWYDTHRRLNPFPLTRRKELTCILRTIK